MRRALTSLPALLAAALAAGGAAGCASLRHAELPPVKAVQVGGSKETAADGYYADACAAIRARDYGRALDLLQMARRGRLPEARVLNAFGVVYDKLGRFDLSARYYAQALAIDPGSPIVKANLDYSRRLQQGWRAESDRSAPAPAPAHTAEGLRSAAEALPPLAALWETPADLPLRGSLPARLAGPAAPRARPLRLLDASGDPERVRRLSRRLRELGWGLEAAAAPVAAPALRSTIRYPAQRARIALALARSLPGAVTLRSCGQACARIEVVFGADARRWTLASSRHTPNSDGEG